MSSYEIIKNGLENGLDDASIIERLQLEYPTSQIETNIFLIDETRNILESSIESISTEIELNHFLVKNGKEFIDLFSGRKFKAFKDKPYSLCHHGLCKEYKTLILKNVIKNLHIPSVFIAINEESIEHKLIKIKYRDNNKKQRVWNFDSYEINECMRCIDNGLKDGQIATKLFCPKECINGLREKLIRLDDIERNIKKKKKRIKTNRMRNLEKRKRNGNP